MTQPPPTRATAWEAYFTTTSRLSERLEREIKRHCSLSLAEYNVLLQVSRSGEEGIRPATLARQVVFSPSRLTHTLHRLQERGLVERRRCETDGRGEEIHLSAQGRTGFAAAAGLHRDVVRRLVLDDLVPGEEAVLERVFTRIAHRLDEDARGARP